MIINEDALVALQFLEGESFDHMVCDPPYSQRVHTKAYSKSLDKIGRARDFGYSYLSPELRNAICSFASRNVKRWVVIFSDVETSYLWRLAGVAAGLDYVRTRAWQRWSMPQFTGDRPSTDHEHVVFLHRPGKKFWNGGGGGKDTFLTDRSLRWNEKGRAGHPNEKPLELMLELISLVAKPGELVIDPCAGSGTTGLAALQLGCDFLGIEKDPKWASVAQNRLASF